MAVIIKYVVERHGVEVKVFSDKKDADAYDKMLDAAEALSDMIAQADIDFEKQVDRQTIDAITLYLAENAPDVVSLLKGIKPASGSAAPPVQKPTAKETVKKTGKS